MITQTPTNKESIDYSHQKVHEGRFFSGGYYNASVADTASINVLFQNSTNYTHTKVTVASSGNCLLYIFEDTTVSSAGTTITPINHNRSSSKTLLGTLTHTPTITGDGTQLNGPSFIPAGDKHSGAGGEMGFNNELILDISTNYLFRVTNVSGGAAKIGIHVEGYQPAL